MPTPRVSLFIPCLIEQVYPEMGAATAQLLRHLGCEVDYNPEAACCGRVVYSEGRIDEARAVAETFIEVHAGDEAVVCPSGSCTAMVKECYPQLFKGSRYENGADMCREHTFELSQFLVREGLCEKIEGCFLGKVGSMLSCHSQRYLGLKDELKLLFQNISGCEVVHVGDRECCGFGGLFCARFDGIASGMAHTKLEMFLDRGIETIVANDPGCILHLRKEAKFYNFSVRVLHLAEFLVEAMKITVAI